MRRFLGICLVLLCLATTAPALASTEVIIATTLTKVAQEWLTAVLFPSESCEECQNPAIEVGGGMDPNG